MSASTIPDAPAGGEEPFPPARVPAHPDGALRLVLAQVVAAGLLLGATACTGPTEPVEQAAVTVRESAPIPTVVRGACIDYTRSVPAALAAAAVEALASVVEHWVPPPGDPAVGSDPVPRLVMPVRKVTGATSLDPAAQIAMVDIPGVPGVMPQPSAGQPGYLTRLQEWQAQRDAAHAAGTHAREVAEEFAEAIREADWAPAEPEGSEPFGCVEALGATTDGPDRRFALVSDLLANRPPQLGLADFADVRLLVVHVCTEAEVCVAHESDWDTTFDERGAADVEFARPEEMQTALPAWLGSGG